MPFINCRIELSLNWIERHLLTVTNTAIFKITDGKLYVLIVTLSAEDDVKLSKLLSKGFKRITYWNEYKVLDNIPVHIANNNKEKHIRQLLDSSYQWFRRLFVFASNNKEGNNKVSTDSYKKYFLPRVKIENYNIKIDGQNIHDQPINDSIKQYEEISVEISVEKYQQDKVMITQLIVCWILLIFKNIAD